MFQAIQPFYKQIFYWVVNGEIIDSRGEFFIQMENPVESADLKDAWDKQYALRCVKSFNFFAKIGSSWIVSLSRFSFLWSLWVAFLLFSNS